MVFVFILAAILFTLQMSVAKATPIDKEQTLDQALDELIDSIAKEYDEQFVSTDIYDDRNPQEILLDLVTKREKSLEKKLKKNKWELKFHEWKHKMSFTQKAKLKNQSEIERIQNERLSVEFKLLITTIYKETLVEMKENPPKELKEQEKIEEPKQQKNRKKLKPKLGKRYLTAI